MRGSCCFSCSVYIHMYVWEVCVCSSGWLDVECLSAVYAFAVLVLFIL